MPAIIITYFKLRENQNSWYKEGFMITIITYFKLRENQNGILLFLIKS